MKKNRFLIMLIVSALVFGLAGCGDENGDPEPGAFAAWAGEWKVVGVPDPQGEITAGGNTYTISDVVPEPWDGWVLTVSDTGRITFVGHVNFMGNADAIGQFSFVPGASGFFAIAPVSGTLDGRPLEGDEMVMLTGFINNVKQPDGRWIMWSYEFDMFDRVWERQ